MNQKNYVSNHQMELLRLQWQVWCDSAGVPVMCADDLVHSPLWEGLNQTQKSWVYSFIVFWDATVG